VPSETDIRIADIWEAAQAADYLFEVPRWDGCEPVTVLVGQHELTAHDVADLSATERSIYDYERARWAGVEAGCEWLAREADLADMTGADDPAAWRNGEAAVHNGEPDASTVRECALTDLSAAAE